MEQYKRLLRYIRPYWWIMAIATIFSLGTSGITGAMAWFIKPLIDGVKTDINVIKVYPFIYIAFFLSKGLFSFAHSFLMRIIGAKVVRDVRQEIFRKMVLLPISFYVRKPSGELISRVINDTNVMQSVLGYSIKDIFVEGATFIVLFCVAFVRRWDLTLMALIVVPFSFIIIERFGKKMKRISKKTQEQISDLVIRLTESISGIKMIKAFRREELHINKFEDENRNYYRISIKGARVAEYSKLVHEIIAGVGLTIIMFYGFSLIYYNRMTFGEFFSFFGAISLMLTPIQRIAAANNSLQQARAAAERLFYLLDQDIERDGEIDLKSFEDEIVYKDVSFHYPETKRKVLENVSFRVRKGEVIAIVGRSGAGKTTLLDMLPRFYRPTSGTIMIDGIDIKDITLESLRRNIGIVSQDVILFNETVRDNILFGNLDATEEEMIDAAKAAYAHDFIMEMPKGYDSIIGERGIMLSGGQKQRIAIARAILKNPPILILDEATSSLDTTSELIVQKALNNLMKGRTTFVIAHRLSTIMNADRILVLDKARIVESGTHEELIKGEGAYKTLYMSQFKRDASAL
ncbi:MAG: ABC transporter ATP-binding protein [Thermodesulfovibrionia bacterium]